MPIPQTPTEAVPFNEVAAILDAAIHRLGGGPAALVVASGQQLAGALEAADCRVIRPAAPCRACQAERTMMIRNLADRYGDEHTLAMILPRLRCRVRKCGQAPARVTLLNRFPDQAGPRLVEVVLRRPGPDTPATWR